MKIVEVEYLRNSTLNDMETEVREYIKNGWQLYGQLILRPIAELCFIQTVVKYEEPTKKKLVIAKILNGKQQFLATHGEETYFTFLVKDAILFDSYEHARHHAKGYGEVSIEEIH